MNKKIIVLIGIVVCLFLVGVGTFAYTINQNDKKEQEKLAMEKKAQDDAMMKKEEAAAMEKDTMAKEASVSPEEKLAMEKDMTAGEVEPAANETAMSKHGSYVVLADYNKETSKYVDSKKIYFFHASWCPICQSIDREINADITKIPAGVTVIKTDFDNSTSLRQKYGVTTQYTFVQVDNNGTETAQWSATSLAKAIDGIKS